MKPRILEALLLIAISLTFAAAVYVIFKAVVVTASLAH